MDTFYTESHRSSPLWLNPCRHLYLLIFLFIACAECRFHIFNFATWNAIFCSKFFPIVFYNFDNFLCEYYRIFLFDAKTMCGFNSERNRNAIINFVYITSIIINIIQKKIIKRGCAYFLCATSFI